MAFRVRARYIRGCPRISMQAKAQRTRLNSFISSLFPSNSASWQDNLNMFSAALTVALLWSTCYAAPATALSTLFGYEDIYLTTDQLPLSTSAKSVTCKVFPRDSEWPSPQDWDRFNQTLKGSLIRTVPLAASCYPDWPEYNPEQCDSVTNAWNKSSLQYVSICFSLSCGEILKLTSRQRQ